MIPIRCPKCGRLLGYFEGRGETQCPRCRKEGRVYFDTVKQLIRMGKPKQ